MPKDSRAKSTVVVLGSSFGGKLPSESHDGGGDDDGADADTDAYLGLNQVAFAIPRLG